MGTLDIVGPATLVSLIGGKGNLGTNTQGWVVTSISGAPTDQQLIDFFATNQVEFAAQVDVAPSLISHGRIVYGFDETTPIFSLDGNSPISFNDLPAGFLIVALTLNVRLISEAQFPGTSPGTVKLSFEPLLSEIDLPNNVDPNPTFDHTYTEDLIPPGESLTPTDFLDNQLFIDITYDGGGASGLGLAQGIKIRNDVFLTFLSGTYELQQFKFSLDTDAPVTPGDTITVSSNDKETPTLPLDGVTEIDVNYTTLDNVEHTTTLTVFTASPNLLTFILPDIEDAPVVSFVIRGTSFSGSVPLGKLLTINFIDGTGIYKLDLTATHDTLYVQDYDPFQTIDVKIPNPFAKTAFVP